MSLISSLYTGASGVQADSTDMGIIGDNVANANTIGFKGSRAEFADIMDQDMIGGGTGSIGLGTRVAASQMLMAQGSIANTGNSTDLALDGNGFFEVKDADGNPAYTRAGQFSVDNGGFLVNPQGLKVQGFGVDANGNVNGTLGDLDIGKQSIPPKTTTSITIKQNLNAAEPIQGAAFDPANPMIPTGVASGHATTSIVDSLGASHQVDIYFVKTGDGSWEYHATTDGANQTGGTPGTPFEIASGNLSYDTNGNLTGVTPLTDNFLPPGATQPQPLNFNFGTVGKADGVSQFADPSLKVGTVTTPSFISQDGTEPGSLSRVTIDDKGDITGVFTNGQSKVIGQVAVADFQAPDQLRRLGNNLYGQTPGSGDAAVGAGGTSGRGTIVAGALEQSNVDLSQELINMIVAQRSFQANSKTLSTSDQMLQELMDVKR
ncbi:MAG TPA: flagellar hook protein FlgE [Myxococcota bacterium]|jgi:flagellar hook protein FlgE